MKILKYLSFSLLLLDFSPAIAQQESPQTVSKQYPVRKLTIEPGLGLKPYPLSDVLVSNIIQWNLKKRLSIVSHSSYTYNNAFVRNFNYIKTNYNYSVDQKFGIGTSISSKHFSHTLSLMAGIKYDDFKETLDNPEFEKVVVKTTALSPDLGLMYNLKIGRKKYFFSYRMFLPLYPYPFLTSDINSMDGNLANITIEAGVGIRLK